MKTLIAVLAIPLVTTAAEIKTGGSRMIEVDGKYHVWTDRVG